MKIGVAGDGLSLARVIIAMVVGAFVLGVAGYLFDRVIGPLIAMSGWWTVTGSLGFILGGMFQAAREWAVPQPAERRAVAARLREREAAETAAAQAEADDDSPAKTEAQKADSSEPAHSTPQSATPTAPAKPAGE
jgi:hypothetical protein